MFIRADKHKMAALVSAQAPDSGELRVLEVWDATAWKKKTSIDARSVDAMF
jgi:hypothetical protein